MPIEIQVNQGMKNHNHDDNIEVVEVIEDDPTNIESLQGWTKMKMRGFKRVSPSTPPTMNPTSSSRQNTEYLHKRKQSALPAPPTTPPPTSSSSPGPQPITEPPTNLLRGKYCHYFVNSGRCDFEEKT